MKKLLSFCLIGINILMSCAFAQTNSPWINSEIKAINSTAKNINPEALKTSLIAYQAARQKNLDAKQLLTLIDYSKPSSERRLWVIDLKTNKVLFNTWVAHGVNSGRANSTSFSNRVGSLKSSIGVFMTDEPYFGHDGYSLRVNGLESGVNSNAMERNVVFHGAMYASAQVAQSHGMLGRSWGCMAVGENTIKPLVNTIKDHTLVVAYYPDKKWLSQSPYLHSVNV